MANWKEGDHVRVVTRPVLDEDRKTNRYFDHMAGLSGTIHNIYSEDEIAIKVDRETMSKVTADVQKIATDRMRQKFLDNVSEDQKRQLTQEELNFDANYVLLVRSADLERV